MTSVDFFQPSAAFIARKASTWDAHHPGSRSRSVSLKTKGLARSRSTPSKPCSSNAIVLRHAENSPPESDGLIDSTHVRAASGS